MELGIAFDSQEITASHEQRNIFSDAHGDRNLLLRREAISTLGLRPE